MTNNQVLDLAQRGIYGISFSLLNAEDAYKVYKFKRAISNAAKSIIESVVNLQKEYGIQSPDEFDATIVSLQKEKKLSAEKKKDLESMLETRDKYFKAQELLVKEDANVKIDMISPESVFKLRDVNGEMLSESTIASLEGILWEE